MNVDRWNEFWNRSHIYVNPGEEPSDSAWVVGRNYQLFRYMLATNQGGKLPLLFNGGILLPTISTTLLAITTMR